MIMDEKIAQEHNTYQGGSSFMQQPLPDSTAVLVLGILSILFSFWFNFIGLVLGIIALVKASKANSIYLSNPNMYLQNSYVNMRAGKICAIVGTSLSAMFLLITLMFIGVLVSFFTSLPWNMMHP
jgi:hypothetical protein